MALEVYWGSGSGPAWRVLLALAIKKVPYESHLLSFSKREHHADAILEMSPRGKVPVIRDGAFALSESLAILVYLDKRYPEPPLFGASPEAAGLIMRSIMEHECYGVPAISAFARPLLFGKLDTQRDQVLLSVEGAKAELGRLEAALSAHRYLASDFVSAADVFVFPLLRLLERALGKPGAGDVSEGLAPLSTNFPRIAAWMAAIEAIPGYEATYPPHWRDS